MAKKIKQPVKEPQKHTIERGSINSICTRTWINGAYRVTVETEYHN